MISSQPRILQIFIISPHPGAFSKASRRDVAWLRNRVAQLDERNSQMFSEVEQWRHAEGAAMAKQPRKGSRCLLCNCVLLGGMASRMTLSHQSSQVGRSHEA